MWKTKKMVVTIIFFFSHKFFSISFFFSELKCRDWMIIVKNFFCHCRNIRPVERYRRSSASSLNYVILVISFVLGETTLTVLMLTGETISMESEIVRVVSPSTTEILEITWLKIWSSGYLKLQDEVVMSNLTQQHPPPPPPPPSFFIRLVLQTHKNSGLFGKGLNSTLSYEE